MTGTKTVTLVNLIPNPSFDTTASWSGVTRSTTYAKYGAYSSRLGSTSGTGTYINTVKPSKVPVQGHKYYGRHSIRTAGNVTTAENRFELFAGDGAGLNWVFGHNSGNHPGWYMESAIHTLDTLASAAANYSIRNFTVNASNYVYCDGLMLIDLTAAFGAGNEPSKEWCDRAIPFFEGSLSLSIYSIDAFAITGASFSVNPANINQKTVLRVSISEETEYSAPTLYMAGEFYSGEV